jgi:hypothetical protein
VLSWLKNKFGVGKDLASLLEGHYSVRYMPERLYPYVVVNSRDSDFLIAQFKKPEDANQLAMVYNAQAQRRHSVEN